MKTIAKKKMTKAQMRVAIAKDVIKQIALQRFVPRTGDYLHGFNYELPAEGVDVSEHTKARSECKVCALGACFIAAVERFDRLPGNGYDSLYDMMLKYLNRFFPLRHRNLIEGAFEGYGSGQYLKTQFPDAKSRLEAIMHNIIANRGTFTPKRVSP